MGNCMKGSGPQDGGVNKEIENGKNNTNNNNNGTATNNNTKPVKSDRTINAKKKSTQHTSSRSNQTSIHGGILREQTIDVYKKYEEVEVLGTGSMGHVSKVAVRDQVAGSSTYRKSQSNLDRSPGSNDESDDGEGQERKKHKIEYALKSIQLERVTPSFVDELKNEIDILNAMDHPNIIRLHEVYYHRRQIYMILELCDGGDLYTRLPYSEKDAAYITGKLLSAITYMHEHGIVHRDLKFENILFESKSPEAEIKVIDFGLSKKFANNRIGVMREGVGTLYSMAPQVLQGVYTSQADMWSCGVITYMLVSSHRPFYNKKRNVMIDRIMRCDYTYEKDYWKPVSDEAKDFISRLLVLDPKVRYTSKQAQGHIWMSKEFKLSDRAPSASMSELVADNLLLYKDSAQLKKIALNVIAHQSTSEEVLQLRKAFDQFDTANNGVISFDEFKAAVKDKFNYSDKEMKALFDSIDVNHNGIIMYTEFIAASLEALGYVEEERIAEAFDRLDCDNSGFISRENLLEFLGESSTMKDVDAILGDVDLDSNGQISYEEFRLMFRTQNLTHLNLESMESSVTSVELVGLDAVIPGGKYDDSVTLDEKGMRETGMHDAPVTPEETGMHDASVTPEENGK